MDTSKAIGGNGRERQNEVKKKSKIKHTKLNITEMYIFLNSIYTWKRSSSRQDQEKFSHFFFLGMMISMCVLNIFKLISHTLRPFRHECWKLSWCVILWIKHESSCASAHTFHVTFYQLFFSINFFNGDRDEFFPRGRKRKFVGKIFMNFTRFK